MAKNTDVHGSIAGYYYQVLLACRELTKLEKDEDCVGVECGADIRIIKSGKKTSIEAKFHKEGMGLYNPDIVKTIYNFYRYSSNDEKLFFSTNVTMTSKSGNELLYKDWKDPTKKAERLSFIKRCILKHSLHHCKNAEFEKYKKEVCKNEGKRDIKDIENQIYIQKLEKEIFDENKREYKTYAYVDESVDYNSLADKLEFKFEAKEKDASISDLRKEISDNIRDKFLEDKESDLGIVTGMIDALVYKFFQVITRNSKKDTPSFEDLEKVSIKDLKVCIASYEEMLEKYNSVCELVDILKSFEKEENTFIEVLEEQYSGQHKDLLLQRYRYVRNVFQKYISEEKNFNNLIKTYSIDEEGDWDSILNVISLVAIISTFKAINEDNIDFFRKGFSIDNVFIKDVMQFCYKNFPRKQYVSSQFVVKKFLYSVNLSHVKDNQIVVLSTSKGFQECDKPCRQRNDINKLFINSIAQAEKEQYERYFKTVYSVDYKCDQCILSNKSDNEIIKKLNQFLNKKCREVNDG